MTMCNDTSRPAVHCRFRRMREVLSALDHYITQSLGLRVLTNLPKNVVVGAAIHIVGLLA